MKPSLNLLFTCAVVWIAAAGAALGLGMLHVHLPFATRWCGSVVLLSSARLAALADKIQK